MDSEDVKEVARNEIDVAEPPRPSAQGGMGPELNAVDSRNAGEDIIASTEFPVEGPGEEVPAPVWHSIHAAYPAPTPEEHKLLRSGYREVADKYRVEQREYRGIGSDAQGQGENGNRGETRVLRQLPQRVAKILKQSVHSSYLSAATMYRPHSTRSVLAGSILVILRVGAKLAATEIAPRSTGVATNVIASYTCTP